MAKQKTPHDVLGFSTKCVNFMQCPLCYGCRSYSTADPSCVECAKDRKQNICNTDLHKAEVISKFITKNQVVLTEETVKFKSNREI